jgi:hypothetical protein
MKPKGTLDFLCEHFDFNDEYREANDILITNKK